MESIWLLVGITALSGAPTVLGAVLGLLTGLIIIYL